MFHIFLIYQANFLSFFLLEYFLYCSFTSSFFCFVQLFFLCWGIMQGFRSLILLMVLRESINSLLSLPSVRATRPNGVRVPLGRFVHFCMQMGRLSRGLLYLFVKTCKQTYIQEEDKRGKKNTQRKEKETKNDAQIRLKLQFLHVYISKRNVHDVHASHVLHGCLKEAINLFP